MPIQESTIAKATLSALPDGQGQSITVHFNPASLVYSVENSIQQQSAGPKKVQYVAQQSGKLSMDLQFDTTGTGEDVRNITNGVAQFMQASGNATASSQTTAAQNQNANTQGPPPKAPPVLLFQWGSYQFQGIMDSFKETIDFFSNDGVALRALVSIQLSRQDLVFDEDTEFAPSQASLVPSSFSDNVQSLASRGGDPNAMRQLGSDNGLDSLRFTNGVSLEVSAGVQLNPPAAFVTASASAGLGLSGGISAGASAGISLGASAGISVGASAGASAGFGASAGVSAGASLSGLAPSFGASASAGMPASLGAFNGLQAGVATKSTTANLNPLRMVAATTSANVSTYNGASFNVGGAALSTGSAGLSTDVGQQFDYSSRLTFSSDD